MYPRKLFIFICLSFLFTATATAQTTEFKVILMDALENGDEVRITLVNGNTFSGKVISVDDESVGVETKDGLFNFNYDRIKEITIVDPSDRTTRWYKNPASNKLFITQSGRMLEARSGYYQNTYIFFSNISYGITKNISVSGGISMIPELGFENQLKNIGVKVGVNLNESFSVSGTATYYSLFDSDFGFTSVFGAATYTRKELDLTAGLGVATAEGETTDPVFIVGGQLRVSQRFALLSENFVFPTESDGLEPLISFGGRFIGQRIAADLGFFTTDGAEGFFPFVSFAVKL